MVGYNTTGVGGGWDGVVGYEYGLRGYAAWYVRYGRCIARIKEKKRKKRKKGKKKRKKNPWMYKQTMGIGEVGGWAIVQ